MLSSSFHLFLITERPVWTEIIIICQLGGFRYISIVVEKKLRKTQNMVNMARIDLNTKVLPTIMLEPKQN